MKRILVTATAITAIITISGCSSSSSPKTLVQTPTHSQKVAAAPATITAPNLSSVSTDLSKNPLKFSTTGKFKSMTVTGPENTFIKVKSNDDSHWEIDGSVSPSQKYVVHATAVNADGKETVKEYPFTSSKNLKTASYTLFPWDGTQYGVGMPITVMFHKPVKDRKWVEEHLKVTTSPTVEGSWGWVSNEQVVWRPDSYWKPGTTINTVVNLKGVDMGNNVFGRNNIEGSYKIGRSMMIEVSDPQKNLKVVENGKTVKTFPVSLGKASTRTVSGISIIYEKDRTVRMKGVDYDEMVDYAQRYTTQGQYLHSAPWSVYAQGKYNVSHGCVNIGPSNAIWLFKNTLLGDVVKISGTGFTIQKWDGMGAIWNYSVSDWKKMSALS